MCTLASSEFAIAAIDVKFWMSPRICDIQIISTKLLKFRYWQDMFSPHQEESTPAFCAEAPEAKSVNRDVIHSLPPPF